MISVFNEKNYLWVVFGCITSLFILGAIALWDVTPAVMQHHFYTPVTRFHWLGNHIASFIAGMILLSLLMRVKICPVKRMVAWPLGIMAIIILTLTLVVGIGVSISGARRYIALFGHAIYVGPWAIMMLMPLFIYLFDTVKTYKGTGRFLYSFGIITLILFVNLLFIFQPDVRMNILLDVIIALLFLKSGDIKKRAYIVAGVIFILTAIVYVDAVVHQHAMRYRDTFEFYNGRYGSSGSYDTWLAMRDIKAGGLFGSGLGYYSTLQPKQNPYFLERFLITVTKYIPQVTAREFGLAGVSLIFILYSSLIYALFTQIKQVADKQRRLLGNALLLFLAIQAFFPLLRVVHAFPFPAYGMPFMGYGTEGMLMSCITVGLLLGLVRNRPAQEGITPEKEGRSMGEKLLAFFQKQNKVTLCVAGVASLCAIVAIGCLLAYRHELMRGIAARMNIRKETIPPVRGEIFDRNMRPLALHSQKTSLFVTGEGVADNELADKAAHILGSDRCKIRGILIRKKPFSWVARKIDEDKAQKIREIDVHHRFKTRDEPVREYPQGKTFARHLLGFTNIDNDGMGGIELFYNNVLTSSEKGVRYLFNNHRYEFPPKQQGENLILNLDAELQGMLKQHIDDGWVEMKHPSIIAIAMDAERGEILASVVRPGMGKQPSNLFSKIRNRAVTDMFEPGNDIMNLFINAAALEEGIISADGVAVATTA